MYEIMMKMHPDIIDEKRYIHAMEVARKYNYDASDDSMKVIGITGTKGKTTTSYMIKNILEHAGKKVAICGTIGAYIGDEYIEERNTTPSADEVYRLLTKAKNEGMDYFVMEVSSQGLKQCRVAGIRFHYGVFTNISKDHIGGLEHKDMSEYIFCKSLLFGESDVTILNFDEPVKNVMAAHAKGSIKYYGVKEYDEKKCTLTAEILQEEKRKEELKNEHKLNIRFLVKCDDNQDYNGIIDFPLLGRFNVSNSLAAMMVTLCENISFSCVKEALENFSVRGREETLKLKTGATVIIDYAHNAASMESILTDIRTYGFDRVICMFGCGGNRSEERRCSMGEMAGKYADLSVITEDNSRMENVYEIIADVEKGVLKSKGKYVIIPERKMAIEYCMAIAKKNDVILLLGKGHETYQDSGGVKRPFDERQIVKDFDKLL
ncbi:MAG: UDP-N-acetylmuramoyl-L-alanyl-D-glutamate--2,6-diaminopimelate ligase [Lachnospiraceae bacterium]|nr:UDP-N-acetylmuramoyl-L-alanyl-D-glutamate--2,6-diaminopimelate ligase [Lachnospiraceae bacterium]